MLVMGGGGERVGIAHNKKRCEMAYQVINI